MLWIITFIGGYSVNIILVLIPLYQKYDENYINEGI
jgi:hypothetical protein